MTQTKEQFDLSLITSQLHAQAIEAINARDSVGLLCSLDNTACLAFVFDNHRALLARGMFEQALVDAYSGTRTNHRRWDPDVIYFLFALADRDRLRECGPALPEHPVTLYRGVAGYGRLRRLDGFSWTTEVDAACWFALRFSLPHPAVWTATVPPEDIYCRVDDRGEGEYLAQPRSRRRYSMTLPEMQAGADRWRAAIRWTPKEAAA